MYRKNKFKMFFLYILAIIRNIIEDFKETYIYNINNIIVNESGYEADCEDN